MKSNILFLLHLPPPIHGSSMVGKFIKESQLINDNYKTSYINLLASKNVDDAGNLNLLKVIGVIKVVYQLFLNLIFYRPRLCYIALTATGFAFYRDLLLITIIKMFPIKRIYHLHNKGIKEKQNSPVHNFFYRFAFKNAKVIILSERLYEDIAKFVPKTDVFICPNGIPEISQSFLHYNKRVDSIPTILFLSNLIESKGVFILLEAMAILNQNGIDFKGIFVGGEGDISKELLNRKIQELELYEVVSYLGKRFGEEKEEMFKQADIFAFPTYFETFGLVIIEAMQHSLPVISTTEGGIPDIIENGVNGYLVPQRNIEMLAEKLEILIGNEALRLQMGENGYKRYKQQYTLERFESNLEKILKEVS
jgi:glycosyltransferase involved in cell wall biosynthesis